MQPHISDTNIFGVARQQEFRKPSVVNAWAWKHRPNPDDDRSTAGSAPKPNSESLDGWKCSVSTNGSTVYSAWSWSSTYMFPDWFCATHILHKISWRQVRIYRRDGLDRDLFEVDAISMPKSWVHFDGRKFSVPTTGVAYNLCMI